MFLLENGYFGCPETISLEKLLVIAFRDFKAFQRQSGHKCSQTKFVPRFVLGRIQQSFCRVTNLFEYWSILPGSLAT